MSKQRLKSLSIVMLAMVAVFQAGRLWFDLGSGHNFFYALFSRTPELVVSYVVPQPTRWVVNYGNQSFGILYSTLEENAFRDDAFAVVELLLSSEAELISEGSIDWDNALRAKSVIFDYNFVVPEYLLQNSNSNLMSFDGLIIVPGRSSLERLRVIVLDTQRGVAQTFGVPRIGGVNENLLREIDAKQAAGGFVYISSKQNGFDLFLSTEFIPIFEADMFYNPVMVRNSFRNGVREDVIDIFFDNPAIRWSSTDLHGVYSYGNHDVVVRYYPWGVLEYNDYMAHRATASTLTMAYNIFLNFVRQDFSMTNDIYLVDFKFEDGVYWFAFDYVVDGLPVSLSDEMRREFGIEHAITGQVANNAVIRYTRLTAEFVSIEDEFLKIENNFFDALNLFYAEFEDEGEVRIERSLLSYLLDGQWDKRIYLNYWIYFVGGHVAKMPVD